MEITHDIAWKCFEENLKSPIPITQKWELLIESVVADANSSFTASLKSIDIASDMECISNWLNLMIEEAPIQATTKALWFGIFTGIHEGNEIIVTYCHGFEHYNIDNLDWTTNPTYTPDNCYYAIDGLQQIMRIAKSETNNRNLLDWILPLAYCSFILFELLNNAAFSDDRKCVCGYDSGDYIFLN